MRVRAALVLVLVVAIALVTACGGAPPRPFSAELPPSPRRFVVGDLQHTAPVLETGREQNDPERLLVVGAIAAERPDLVVVAGDCVFDGASADQWRVFDRETDVRGLTKNESRFHAMDRFRSGVAPLISTFRRGD